LPLIFQRDSMATGCIIVPFPTPPLLNHLLELLHLFLPDFERADRIGEFWGNPKTRTFGELLIDCGRIGR
jgi:hypothetical protein